MFRGVDIVLGNMEFMWMIPGLSAAAKHVASPHLSYLRSATYSLPRASDPPFTTQTGANAWSQRPRICSCPPCEQKTHGFWETPRQREPLLWPRWILCPAQTPSRVLLSSGWIFRKFGIRCRIVCRCGWGCAQASLHWSIRLLWPVNAISSPDSLSSRDFYCETSAGHDLL